MNKEAVQKLIRSKIRETDEYDQSYAKGGIEGPCWMWLGHWTTGNYGQVMIDWTVWRTHRLAYEAFVGDIPEGHYCLHKCDNRWCCQPLHLFVGTHQDNSDDKISKGRANFTGRTLGLSERQVHQIRAMLARGMSLSEIGRHIGVAHTTISRVRDGKTWGGLPHAWVCPYRSKLTWLKGEPDLICEDPPQRKVRRL